MTIVNAATMPTHQYIERLAEQNKQTSANRHQREKEMEQVAENQRQFEEAVKSINRNKASLEYEKIQTIQHNVEARAEAQRIQQAREAGSHLGTRINTFA